MKNFKIILKTFLNMTIAFFTLSLLITLLNYFNIFNYKTMNIIKIIVPLLIFILGGYKIGKSSLKNGWLEGLKLSSLICILFIIITLILKSFKISYLIYISILIITGIFGSIIGINKRKEI